MKVNVWKSLYSNMTYEMPLDWLPQFDGWELIGTIEKQCRGSLYQSRELYAPYFYWRRALARSAPICAFIRILQFVGTNFIGHIAQFKARNFVYIAT